jgi:integrase
LPRPRSGGIKKLENGLFQVRVSFTGADGRRHERLRKNITTKSEARKTLREFLEGLEDRGERAIQGDRLMFRQLADLYAKDRVFEARYVGDRKVAGLRSVAPVKTSLLVLKHEFGNVMVKDITVADIHRFKSKRLSSPTVRNSQRSISSVNRELALLRKILNFAIEHRWIKENPFQHARLISAADEKRRDRILDFTEERALLAACDEQRTHLKPIVITALDTGCRLGELLKLRWSDVDFDNEVISILAFNSKTAEAREVGITPRVREELSRLWANSNNQSSTLVFGIQNSIKRSWATACRKARIDDLHFHDLRHTAITRMVASGLATAEIMRISGHRQTSTFLRYVNPKRESLRKAASALSNYIEANGLQ